MKVGAVACQHGIVNDVCWTCYVLANPLPHLKYTEWIEEIAAVMGSDGCTGVSALYRWCCKEHDIHYRARVRRHGVPITKAEADTQFRSCIQRHSPIGWWSPLAWIRWIGVHLFGRPKSRLRTIPSEREKDIIREAQLRRMEIMREVGVLQAGG